MFALSFSVHCTLGESFHISRASSQACEMFYIVLVRDKFKLLPGGTRKREFALYRIKISPAKKVPDSLE